ncbi:MAG: isoprenylcysteine carboxylmethyltransferase family protein [Chloroflexi bacterium]|nr:isoprenylcysteine carboxylmethyltransferase family protein [Chloroflexota bacterium]
MFWIILLTLLIFAVPHSLLAGQNVKNWIRERLGARAYEGFYRIGYNVFATITLLPISALLVLAPGAPVWHIEGAALWPLLALQAVGAVGFALSLLQIDLWRFAGVRQLLAYVRGEALPLADEPLQTHGVYSIVRHPLYLFSLLVMWPLGTMYESTLALNTAATLYFIIGSRLEERRMVAAFGQPYIEYQRRVPWLIPGLRRIVV